MRVRIDNGSVTLSGRRILENINLAIESGSITRIGGCNGSGKTTLMKLLAGRLWPDRREMRTYFYNNEKSHSPLICLERIALVSNEQHEFYLRNEKNVIVDGLLYALMKNKPYLRVPESFQPDAELLKKTGLEYLREKPVLNLSQGELRRVLITGALLSEPELLLIDEFLHGIDAASRDMIIQTVLEYSDAAIVYTAHHDEDLLPETDYVYRLPGGPRFTDSFRSAARIYRNTTGHEILFRAEHCSVVMNNRQILTDISFTLRKNEKWYIQGNNGSGKTTLLRLIAAQVMPVYGGRVEYLPGTENTILDYRSRVTFLSFESAAMIDTSMSVIETIAAIRRKTARLFRPLTADEEQLAEETRKRYFSSYRPDAVFKNLSTSEKRILLTAAHLLNGPLILLLDEPFGGLDPETREQFADVLNSYSGDTAIVLVTHYSSDDISGFHRGAAVKAGRLQI